MNVIGQEVESPTRVEDAPACQNLWQLLNRFGSLELVIGLTTGGDTLSLVQHLKSVTKGLLELNAVLLWSDHFSTLTEKEILQWRRQFGLPFRSLEFKDPVPYQKYDRGLVPVEFLPNLFVDNGIRVLLTASPCKSGFELDWDGEIVFVSQDRSSLVAPRITPSDGGASRHLNGERGLSPVGAVKNGG